MKHRWRHRLSRLFSPQGFRGPVLTLLSGTTVVLALAYLAQPLLTRLYTPAAFGLSDYFVALTAVLASFASLRYEDALMLPEDDEEAGGVFWLALAVLCVFVGLIGVAMIWRREIAALTGLPALAPWLLLVPPTLLAMRTARIFEAWLIRARRFRNVTAGQVSNALVTVSGRVGAGLPPVDAGVGGLIGGFFAGHAASMLVLGRFVLGQGARVLAGAFRWSQIRRAARRYRRFPLFSTPSTLLATLVGRLPVLLLPLFFDAAVLGLFGRAFAVLGVPLSLIGGAIAQVFFVHAAEAHRDDRLPEVTRTVHRRLVMLGLFPTLALLVAGPDVFEVVFGAAWREAGRFVQYIGPWLFLASVASPLTRLFDVLERQRLDFLTSLLMFVALAAAMLVGGRTGEVTTTLLLVGVAGAAVRVVHLAVLLRLAGVSYGAALPAYGRYLVFSLPGLLLLGGALLLHRPWLTTLAAVLAGAVYAGLVLWQDRLLAARPRR